jgi:hypothetical protein
VPVAGSDSELTSDPRPLTSSSSKPRREKRKTDPRLIAAARELRDRWLEAVDRDPDLILPSGKYDLARTEIKALPAAA